jgi:trigger factor
MTVAVETLSALERKVRLSIPKATINAEVDTRLKRLARTVKADGFRPGKVPMKVVAQRYGYSVEYEVMQDTVGEAFMSATKEAKLRIAGSPNFSQITEGVAEDQIAFDAAFEVYPDIKVPELASVEVEKIATEVTDEAVGKTVEILRKQRRTFAAPGDSAAQAGDRATVDFLGKIDGVAFEGGSATDFGFILADGRMLPEFEAAALGMKAGEEKLFDLKFPEDYQGKEVAGKTAQFTITMKKLEAAQLPAVDNEFAKALGIADGNIDSLKADIRKNLEREVKFRLTARNKQNALEALAKAAQVDVPKALIANEVQNLTQRAREDLKQRGVKDADTAPIPEELFKPQAEQRVKMGLVVGELVNVAKLQATPEQIKAHIDELAQSYEKPADVVTWYYSKRERLSDVEAVVIENNVAEHILATAKVTEKKIAFDEVMGA